MTVRNCELCNLFEAEDPKHLMLWCPRFDTIRNEMFNAINESCQGYGEILLANTDDLYAMLLGKHNIAYPDELNWEIRCTTARYVYMMYIEYIRTRDGIG